MDKQDIIKMAHEAQFEGFGNGDWVCTTKEIERFAALVATAERESIASEWWMCVQSDLEHGVKSLNEQAAKDFNKNYPEISKFGAYLESREWQ